MTNLYATPNYFIPNKILCGCSKYDTNNKVITLKKSIGGYLMPSVFKTLTGYDAIDNPRDSIVAFERDATGKISYYDNVLVENLKVKGVSALNKNLCICIDDPRGWEVKIPYMEFITLITTYNVSISNATLVGKFIYAVHNGSEYMILPENHQIKGVVTQDELDEYRKKIRTRKLNIVPGKVYDYYNKALKYHQRMLYLGHHPRIMGENLLTRYNYKKIPEKLYNDERHIWINLDKDQFGHDRVWTVANHHSHNYVPNTYEIIRSCENTNEYEVRSVPRYKPPQTNSISLTKGSVVVGQVREFTYFDQYLEHAYNYEFTVDNIVTTGSIDKNLIDCESSDQSYSPSHPSVHRKKVMATGDNIPLYPRKWSAEELLEACKLISFRYYRTNAVYFAMHSALRK